MSKEQIAALNRVLNYAENANCDDLHHPKKFLHDNIFNCPAQDAMRSDVSIVRKFFQHQEARVKDLEETNRITASLLFERDKKNGELEKRLEPKVTGCGQCPSGSQLYERDCCFPDCSPVDRVGELEGLVEKLKFHLSQHECLECGEEIDFCDCDEMNTEGSGDE